MNRSNNLLSRLVGFHLYSVEFVVDYLDLQFRLEPLGAHAGVGVLRYAGHRSRRGYGRRRVGRICRSAPRSYLRACHRNLGRSGDRVADRIRHTALVPSMPPRSSPASAPSIDSAPLTPSPPTPAPHPSQRPPAMSPATGPPAPGTANSTVACTPWPYPRSSGTPQDGTTTDENALPARVTEKHCAASNDASPTSSTDSGSETRHNSRQAREDTRGRHRHPARPAQPPHTDASDKSLPGPARSNPTSGDLTQRGAD